MLVRGPVPPCTLLSGKFFVPEASTLLWRMAFSISRFSEILGGSQIYTRWPYAPWTPPWRRNFFTQSEYFTIFNCVYNINILALVVSEILGGSQIYVRGTCAPCTPPSGIWCYKLAMKRYTDKQHQSWKVKCRPSFAKALQEGSKEKD